MRINKKKEIIDLILKNNAIVGGVVSENNFNFTIKVKTNDNARIDDSLDHKLIFSRASKNKLEEIFLIGENEKLAKSLLSIISSMDLGENIVYDSSILRTRYLL